MGFSPSLLDGKKILITGAGKGIGRACALMASECGAQVIAVARTESDLKGMQECCTGSVEYWVGDVTRDELCNRIHNLDSLDGLINNAGLNRVAPMIEQTDENIDAVIQLNIRSAYKIAQAAISPMLRAQSGSIVNMSSQMGFVGSPGRTLYCMSKHAIEGLTKAMAVELGVSNIRVNTVAPTFIKTPMTEPMLDDPEFRKMVMSNIPLNHLGTVDDVANACIFLLSSLSNTTTGSCVKVDGGWTAH
ncbi:SDR family NAD(P)-dependent oxidoreductase [Lacimicrobium alkaliphilum]|uniref:L-xylulose reductase n=1 Tax=Lacimicrobium alkaliphilum TaxID=1526571 RepID=A0ABQ1R757_9ALTE|nr:SDR family oxidoreductase [Lacimicrobium alkaliphilum]GGD58384.1 L-xylulose reductase [Lacimicrobium alkaliphilum]